MLKSPLSKLTLGLAALGAAGSAQAQTLDVSVVGQIVPEACAPTIGGGGVVDYGDIPASSINQTTYTVLPTKKLSFTMQCASSVKAMLSSVDNRASSRVPDILMQTAALPDEFNYGLGSVSGAKVGGYSLSLPAASLTADSQAVRPILSNDLGATWSYGRGALSHQSNSRTSWDAQGGTPSPIPFTNLVGEFEIYTVINKGEDLPLQNVVPIDGNATLQVEYL